LQPTLSNRKFKIAFTVWWIDWAINHIVVVYGFDVTLVQAFTDSIITNLFLAGSCWLISNNMRFYLPRAERFWYILVTSVVLSLISSLVIKLTLRHIFSDDPYYLLFLKKSFTIRFWIAFLLAGFMSMMSLLWYSQKEQKQMDMRRAEAEKLEREAELSKLRQQLQPHFLFNSLNSISALTGSQPEKARHMIHQLSEFLRGTIKKDEQHWNTLEEELQYLQLYLDIEKVRFGHRLNTEVTFTEEAMTLKLPALLLQPIVENAIKFGLYDTIDNVLITINANAENNYLKIIVKNPFDAETAQPLKGTGFGLSSIIRRLFLLFARHDLLHIEKDNGHFITTILIPQSA
jgi:two-component system LytT family sensor kinase